MFREITARKWVVMVALALLAGMAWAAAMSLGSAVLGGLGLAFMWTAYFTGVSRTYRNGIRPLPWEKTALGGMLMTAGLLGFMGALVSMFFTQ